MHLKLSGCLLVCFVAPGINTSDAFADDITSLMDMSFQELMQIKVITASILPLKSAETPASITTITREDIAVTPARNLVDLINVYVPGAMSLAHPQGYKIGIRGIVSSNNLKYLLLVNGRAVSDKMKTGVLGEIDQWNLNDIEKIEIIRGPGSVTYGPGAVGGVISITTKTANSFTGKRGGLLVNPQYRSNGGFVEYGYKNNDFGLYTFLSMQRTKGYEDADFYEPNPALSVKFSGKDSTHAFEPNDYLADPLDKPHIKLHIDMSFGDNWRWWSRYTRSGQTYDGPAKVESADGATNSNRISYEGVISTLEQTTKLSDDILVTSTLSLDTHEYRIWEANRSPDYQEDFYINCRYCYSDSELFLRSIANVPMSNKLNVAVGAELSYEWIRAPWNESKKRLYMKDGFNLISGPDSDYVGDGSAGTIVTDPEKTLFIGNGWESNMISVLFEADYQLQSDLKLLASFRTDKNRFTDHHSSPRLALIYSPENKNIYKFVAERSVRLTQTSALFIADELGTDVDPEVLETYEMHYTRIHNQDLTFDLNVFFNDLEVIAWDGSQGIRLGNSKTAGIEFESNYKTGNITLGANHSFVKQLDFSMDDALKDGTKRQGISVADYFFSKDFITLTDEGNDLNNWANQSTKFFITYKPNDHWVLHANTIIYWGMPGAKDELRAFEEAYAAVDVANLTSEEQAEFQQDRNEAQIEIDSLRDQDAFDKDIRLNASVTYKFGASQSDMALTLYLQHIWDVTDNKKYAYSTGSSNNYPNRMEFTQEPFAASVQFTVMF